MLLRRSYRKIEPASAAIIMANGIFLIGAINAFPSLNEHLGKIFAFILVITWIVIYRSLSLQFLKRDFLMPFITHPVNSFAMGTWIAGVSVLCHVLLQYFPSLVRLTQIIALVNSLLWVGFLLTCLYNFKKLLFEKHDYPMHGILLISTVGTQSIIILLNNVFAKQPIVLSKSIILLGLAFYFIGLFLIIKGMFNESRWTIADDWSNTNCIIHGALSITGLAMVTSSTFSAFTTNLLWLIIFILLICVEGIELYRAKNRVKKYGFNKGVFSYHVTQWSRNFTFGMFYVFTLMMHQNTVYILSERLNNFQTQVMDIWAWVVLITLIIEIIIYLKHIAASACLYRNKVAR